MINRIVKLLIAIIFYALYHAAIRILFFFGKEAPGTLVILMYHAVPSERIFSKHLDFIQRNAIVVNAEVNAPLTKMKRHVVITFDDGFTSVIDNAIPMLIKKQIAATLFIPTDYFGQKAKWVTSDNPEYTNETVVTEHQLQDLDHELFTIGSHGASHTYLGDIDADHMERELKQSKEKLEKLINRNISLFSLPFGSYNDATLAKAKEVGYSRVFLNIPSFPASKVPEYLFGRIDISLLDWELESRLKILGAYQWIPIASSIKNRLKTNEKKRKIKCQE